MIFQFETQDDRATLRVWAAGAEAAAGAYFPTALLQILLTQEALSGRESANRETHLWLEEARQLANSWVGPEEVSPAMPGVYHVLGSPYIHTLDWQTSVCVTATFASAGNLVTLDKEHLIRRPAMQLAAARERVFDVIAHATDWTDQEKIADAVTKLVEEAERQHKRIELPLPRPEWRSPELHEAITNAVMTAMAETEAIGIVDLTML